MPIVPDRKREQNLPLEDCTGYREERCAVRACNDELGKLITQQSELFENTSWERFVSTLRGRGDLAPIGENVIAHPSYGLLKHLSTKGAPAIMSTPPWELKQLDEQMKQGSHKSCDDNHDFLRTEILDFVKKELLDSTTLPIAAG